MEGAGHVLRALVAAGLLALAIAAAGEWLHHRDRRRFTLVIALVLLTTLPVIAEVNVALEQRSRAVLSVGTAVLLTAGWALLLVSHTYVPFSRRGLVGPPLVVALTLGMIAIWPVPNRADPHISRSEAITGFVIVAVWLALVGGSAWRAWRFSRGRPLGQRHRLRGLALGYAVIIVTTVVEFAAVRARRPALTFLADTLLFVLVPLLWTSFLAPSFVRRMWGMFNIGVADEAVGGLLAFSPDRHSLGSRAVQSALELVGGDAGAIVDGTGEVLAVVGMTTRDAITLSARAHVSPDGLLRLTRDGVTHLVAAATIESSVGPGILLVQSAASDLFGVHEVRLLRSFSMTVTTALERVRVSEQLARETQLHEQLLRAMSDLGQGFLIHDGRRIVYANDAMSAMTGLSNAELMALPNHRELFAEVPSTTGDHFEARLRCAGGETIDVEVATKTSSRRTIAVVRNVTERKRSEATLRHSEERFRLLVEGVEDYAIYMLDADGRVASWNPGAERIYGWSAAEVLQRPSSLFYPNDDAISEQPQQHLRQAAARGNVEEEGWRVRKDGTRFFASVVVTTLVNEDGTTRGYAVVVRDITERRAVEAALAYQAMHDDLTRLANRTLFLDRLQMALARLERLDTTVAVLFLDLDRFKTINDSLGHRAGDEVLITAAERLMTAVRPGDTVARFGGDEFVVLCDNVSGIEHAIAVANRLGEVLAEPYFIDQEQIGLSASIGIALATGPHDAAETLLRDADAALYRAKELGRDRIAVFDDALRARAVERLETENGLRRAVERGELCVLYQPEVNVGDRRVVAVEALVRWQHPTLGLVSPTQFVPVAEESGLIVPIGNWVIQEACRQSREWSLARPDLPALVVSVNLSARQLSQPDLVDVVATALADTNTSPDTFCLEITESVVMNDVESTMVMLRALKDLGVLLAIDDFGTGYSSLSYLKRFPVDILKVDRSFVAGLGDDPEDSAIVAAVTKMGHTLGLEVVAEGVETVAQVDALRRVRCDMAQGRLFAPPLPPEQAGHVFAQSHNNREIALTESRR